MQAQQFRLSWRAAAGNMGYDPSSPISRMDMRHSDLTDMLSSVPPSDPVADPRPVILLVSERFGDSGGGEAIKGYQFANYLLRTGWKVIVFTHERSVLKLGAQDYTGEMRLVRDNGAQKFFWNSKVLRFCLQPYFHLLVRAMLREELARHPGAIVHYISPVSPVAPRFAPGEAACIYGPMTGNIYYPPGFRTRAPASYRAKEALHHLGQKVMGALFPEKRRSRCLLVSGYERTRESLELAGCDPARILDVVDSGVDDRLADRPRMQQTGRDLRFYCAGRMVDYKGSDLAIKALAQTREPVTLDIFGDGDKRAELEALTDRLGLRDRVTFRGWMPNSEFLATVSQGYRGFVFPSLAEANGIVMQEAMMMGLPIVALRWGGPMHLAGDDAVLYIAPENEAQVVRDIAAALDRLATDGAYADSLSRHARAIAQERFTWDAVAESWLQAYAR